MANEISIAEKQTIALLYAQGESNREIARLLGLDRGTVNRQVRLLKAQNRPEAPPGKTAENSAISRELVSANSSLSGHLTPGLEAVAPCGTKQPGVTTSLCTEFHEIIVSLLEQGLEAQRIWQDLVTDHGFTGKYCSVKRYVAKLRARRPLPFRRLYLRPPVETGGKRQFG